LRVINKKGQIESFWRDKLYLSIYEAIGHLKQPQIASTHLTDTIVSKLILHKEAGALIKTENIINTTKQVIKNYDAAGSVRYMSYRLDMKLPRDIKQTLK
jgi:transcriptional regulator NrdR family protein